MSKNNMYLLGIFGVALLSAHTAWTMEKPITLSNKEQCGPIELLHKIEEFNKEYTELSFWRKNLCGPFSGEPKYYVQELEKLHKRREKYEKESENKPGIYVSINNPELFDYNVEKFDSWKNSDNKFKKVTLYKTDTTKITSDKVLLSFLKPRPYLRGCTEAKLQDINLCLLQLGDLMEYCLQLTSLDVSNNKITDIMLAPRRTSHNKNLPNYLENLNVSHNKLAHVNLDNLFKKCPELQEIDLSYNDLQRGMITTSIPAKYNKAWCESPEYTVPTIKIMNTGLTPTHKEELVKAYVEGMCEARSNCITLRALVTSVMPSLVGSSLFALSLPNLSALDAAMVTTLVALIGINTPTSIVGILADRTAKCLTQELEEHAKSHIICSDETTIKEIAQCDTEVADKKEMPI
jgi:hypothetical protein